MRFVILFLLIGVPLLHAQPSFTVNNLVKYAEGENYLHREDVLDLNVFYKSWTFSTQLEAGNPPEFGKTTYGLHSIRVDYNTADLSIEIGDIYPLWNHGLTLNLRYERDLGYDSGIRGISATRYLPNDITLFGVAGTGKFRFSSPHYTDVRRHNWHETNTLGGAGLRIPFQSFGEFSLSGLYVQSDRPHFQFDENFQQETTYRYVNTQLYEAGWLLPVGEWELLLNHARQFTSLEDPWDIQVLYVPRDTITASRGHATYLSASGLIGELGITVDYKNYAYDIRQPPVYTDPLGNHPTRMSSVSRPPIVYRESSATLTSRQVHLLNYNDEIGYQVEFNYYDLYGFNLLVNYSQASRHRYYVIDLKEYNIKDSRSFFPSDDPGYFPYSQAHLQTEKYLFDNRLFIKQSVNKFYKVNEYSKRISLKLDETVRTTLRNVFETEAVTLLSQIDYTFANGNSVALYHENQWINWINTVERYVDTLAVDEELVDLGKQFRPAYNRFVALSFSHNTGVTVSAIYDYASATEEGGEFNTDPSKDNPIEAGLRDLGVDLRNKWIGIEITADILSNHQLTFVYGSEKGGLRCANGVCRQVAPFEDGFKLTIQSYY